MTVTGEEAAEAANEWFRGLLFSAETKAISTPDAEVAWEFNAPPGVMAQTRLTSTDRVTVKSATYQMEVPKVIERAASNLLTQLEQLAHEMNQVSGRKRRAAITNVVIEPGRGGASGTHGGLRTTIGTQLFFYDTPTWGHAIVHETGHNFDFFHGGLHESVNEACRCFGAEQITEQPAKWMFIDRMNGIPRKEIPYPKYPNVGLYLYCYAQGGPSFLKFMATNERPIVDKLKAQGYNVDDLITALLSIALGRDMNSICNAYGLKIVPERVAQAISAMQPLCQPTK
ncbi:MAG TPA: hypothetical protein VGI75_07025, partial [Pirellulales bacterium]